MADPADKSNDEVREGTETLQEVADEVERERNRKGGSDVDFANEDAQPNVDTGEQTPNQDPEDSAGSTSDEEDIGPLEGEGKETRMGNYARLSQRGGGPQG